MLLVSEDMAALHG